MLDECLRSTKLSPRGGAVIVVDNSITPACADVVRGHPTTHLIRPATNVGFGAAAQHGSAACSSPFVLLLNADTRLTDGAVEAVLEAFDRHRDAVVIAP